eukprot:scaffold199171_cov23-Cyclotella_meneghiniana.AAC.1
MENVPEALRLELANVAAKIEAENFMGAGGVGVIDGCDVGAVVWRRRKADGGAMLCEDVRQSVFGG